MSILENRPTKLNLKTEYEAGINFEHFNGATGEKFFLEALGSGAASFDYDNDGRNP